ncbi:MAG TPA: J domain-containing protein [Bauldia sp.]|nr:J domain-containing protein [Bauldia sp.]
MNLNSKYFDRIRISPDDGAVKDAGARLCEWAGCTAHGGYRAPKGRMREGQYHNFCLDHVREYNKSYNYFAGMGDDDVAAYQRAAQTGHRPTWTIGVNRMGEKADRPRNWTDGVADPFGIFGGAFSAGGDRQPESEVPERRPLRNLERKSFAALDLEGTESAADIKARYKELVKRLHPDANGGDRSSEDRLRQIIQAYHYLKSAGFC